jgi:hypothetical protein
MHNVHRLDNKRYGTVRGVDAANAGNADYDINTAT